MSRRDFFRNAGAGFGSVALAQMLHAAEQMGSPAPHHRATAKNIIFLFMEGGPSHIDLFDPKPLLDKLHGQKLPESFGPVITAMGESDAPLLASKRKFAQHGESGLWISDWLPHTAKLADELCVIRSCYGEGINHAGGVCQMNTGSIVQGRPSLGAWVTYGLGSENANLPAFVILPDDDKKQVVSSPHVWGSGFMPAVYQGTQFFGGEEPIRFLRNPAGVTEERQRAKLAYLDKLNRRHWLDRTNETELDARIKAYELAFRMQAEAPEAIDLRHEDAETRSLYGMDDKVTATFGQRCLLARRLVERGVRFVQLYHGAGSGWDSHAKLEVQHGQRCREMDKPVAGLLADLKRRGLLEETLVVWGGEFGRTPMSEKGDGRDHNAYGFTMWFAGGGVRGGQTIGSTDDLGLHAVTEKLHIHDLHACMLHLLGIDNMKLTYNLQGRPERPTLNEGAFYPKITKG